MPLPLIAHHLVVGDGALEGLFEFLLPFIIGGFVVICLLGVGTFFFARRLLKPEWSDDALPEHEAGGNLEAPENIGERTDAAEAQSGLSAGDLPVPDDENEGKYPSPATTRHNRRLVLAWVGGYVGAWLLLRLSLLATTSVGAGVPEALVYIAPQLFVLAAWGFWHALWRKPSAGYLVIVCLATFPLVSDFILLWLLVFPVVGLGYGLGHRYSRRSSWSES